MAETRIREGLTFDDVLLVPGASEVLPRRSTCAPAHPRDPAQHPAGLRRDGHRHRARDRHLPGAERRHRHHPQEPVDRARRPREVDKVKRSESGMIVDPITMRPEQRIYEALELMARYRISGVPIDARRQGRRHPHQPRPALRARHAPGDLERDDARGPGDGAARHRRWSAPRSCCTSTASRSCWWSTRPGSSARPDHDQGHREDRALPARPARTRSGACAAAPRSAWARTRSSARRRWSTPAST